MILHNLDNHDRPAPCSPKSTPKKLIINLIFFPRSLFGDPPYKIMICGFCWFFGTFKAIKKYKIKHRLQRRRRTYFSKKKTFQSVFLSIKRGFGHSRLKVEHLHTTSRCQSIKCKNEI